MIAATVFGASSGYVSNSIVPLTVSSTTTGPAPGDVCCACVDGTASARAAASGAAARNVVRLMSSSSSLETETLQAFALEPGALEPLDPDARFPEPVFVTPIRGHKSATAHSPQSG